MKFLALKSSYIYKNELVYAKKLNNYIFLHKFGI